MAEWTPSPLDLASAAREAVERMQHGVPASEQQLARPVSPSAIGSTEGQVPSPAAPVSLRGEIKEMLAAGIPALRIQDTLIERGLDKNDVFARVEEALAPPPRPGQIDDMYLPMTQSQPLARVGAVLTKPVGGAIMFLGALIWIGNVSGLFPTIPMLGYGLLLLGGAIFGLGERKL